MQDSYAELNPGKKVPTLIYQGKVLNQSIAILEFLDQVQPEPPLLPSDPFDRATVRALVQLVASDIQPIQNLSVLQEFNGQEEKMAWGRKWCEKGFLALEKMLKVTSGRYCFGDQVTMADLVLVPQVVNAERFGVDMTQFPTIARINDELLSIPAFRRGHWNQQEDCPNELRSL